MPEIEEQLENTDWVPDVKYLAIYLTPIGKYVQDKEQRKIYYKVKEKLLKRNISLQCIEMEKMLKVLENESALEKSGKKGQNFAYTLQNIAIAINAKLGGIPWRINMPIAKALVLVSELSPTTIQKPLILLLRSHSITQAHLILSSISTRTKLPSWLALSKKQ